MSEVGSMTHQQKMLHSPGLICALFTDMHPIPVKHSNSSCMQKQEWEYVWHIKLQTCGYSHSGVKATWTFHII